MASRRIRGSSSTAFGGLFCAFAAENALEQGGLLFLPLLGRLGGLGGDGRFRLVSLGGLHGVRQALPGGGAVRITPKIVVVKLDAVIVAAGLEQSARSVQ